MSEICFFVFCQSSLQEPSQIIYVATYVYFPKFLKQPCECIRIQMKKVKENLEFNG